MPLRALEFFSGIGGLHCALRQVDPEAVVLSSFDINPNAYKVYHHNFPNVPYIQRDITGITKYEIDRFGANVWLLSPPCQPHTRQGMKRDCSDSRSDGLLHLITLLQVVNHAPSYILLENVEGFEESESRNRLVGVLKERNYHFQEFILSPNQFQIPNQRDRYFIIARLTAFPEVPEDTPLIGSCLRLIPGDSTCSSIVYKNGTAEMGTKESQDFWNTMNARCKPIRDFLDSILDIGTDVTPYLVPDRVLQKSGKTLDIVSPDDRFSCCFTKSYRKYHTGTGSLLQTAEPYQAAPVERSIDNLRSLRLRYFSGMEMKRIHGFPESFSFPEDMGENQRAKLVGNISFFCLFFPFTSES